MFDFETTMSILIARATGINGPFAEAGDVEANYKEILAQANFGLASQTLRMIEEAPSYLFDCPILQELWEKTVGELLAACGKREPTELFRFLRETFLRCKNRNALIWSASFSQQDEALKFYKWAIETVELSRGELELVIARASECGGEVLLKELSESTSFAEDERRIMNNSIDRIRSAASEAQSDLPLKQLFVNYLNGQKKHEEK